MTVKNKNERLSLALKKNLKKRKRVKLLLNKQKNDSAVR